MTIRYLGTAAAEGLPAVFCRCPACEYARKHGGKNVRTRSQTMINDDFLIDFPMDTYLHALRHRVDLSAVRHVFITHAHRDHCSPEDFLMHGAPYAHNMTAPDITVYGNAAVLEILADLRRKDNNAAVQNSIHTVELQPYTTVTAGRYTVTPLPAVHTAGENCFVYLIQADGKTYLHAHDSGMLPDEVYDRAADIVPHLDAVSFDCTYGFVRHGAGRHMGALDACDELAKLSARKLVNQNTHKILTHFSHNGALGHRGFVRLAKPLGFEVAHDGYSVKL